jgi:hypothetical protein
MKAEIKKEAIPEAGKVFPMYEWSASVMGPGHCFLPLTSA